MADDHQDRVGVVGAGRMAGAMVGRLREAGRAVVLYNRTRSRAEEVAARTGAVVVETPRAVSEACSVVLVSLADDDAVQAVYAGVDGLVAGVSDGAVVVETSTVRPETVRSLAPQVENASGHLLDAPVSGSVPVVERGQLTFMVGGNGVALDRARPVMDVLATQVFHMGGQGAGSIMKLAVNSVVFALNQGLAEALVLAEKAGVERGAAYDVFSASAVGAPFVHYKRDAFERPNQAGVAFMLSLVAKDLALISELADGVGARMEQLAANQDVVAEALQAGYGERDMAEIATLLRETH